MFGIDDAIIAAVAPAVIGGLFSSSGQQSANQETAASTAQQIAFQREMSTTQHQREVADLKAAGLNPILSGTGGSGAAVPPGASYTAGNVGGAFVSGASSAVQAAREARIQEATVARATYDATTARINSNIALHDNVIREQDETTARNSARISTNEAAKSAASTALELKYMREHPTIWMLNRMSGGASSTAVDIGRLGLGAASSLLKRGAPAAVKGAVRR